MRHITRTLLLVLGICGAVTAVARAQELPEGVTKEMIEEGGTIYRGAGLCHACHGQQGKGLPNLGADLSDDDWIHSDGSLDGIIATIKNGVSGDKSTVGTTMPPKGGSAISDEQVKAVAAYVWSLSHGST
jgi:mono/diheme cytochrome c family protein